MRIGGYQLVDLKNENFAVGTKKTIAGVYDLIEGTRKPILISGIQIASTEYHDAFVTPVVSSSNFVFVVYGYTFTIDADDGITVTQPS